MDKLNLPIIIIFFFKSCFDFFIKLRFDFFTYNIISEKIKQKRTAISGKTKCEICAYHTKYPQISYQDIAIHFNQLYNVDIKRITVSKILKNKE